MNMYQVPLWLIMNGSATNSAFLSLTSCAVSTGFEVSFEGLSASGEEPSRIPIVQMASLKTRGTPRVLPTSKPAAKITAASITGAISLTPGRMTCSILTTSGVVEDSQCLGEAKLKPRRRNRWSDRLLNATIACR